MSEESIDRIGTSLGRLQRIRERAADSVAAWQQSAPIDLASYQSLCRLVIDGPMRAGALAEALHADASTVSRQTAQLVERGLIERVADPADGRASILAPTDRGHEAFEQLRQYRIAKLTAVVGDWSAADLDTFAGLLERFIDDFERVRATATYGTKENV